MGRTTERAMLNHLLFDERIYPVFYGESGVPRCNENCPQFDGKRCRVLGHRPDGICEPTVAEMVRVIRAADSAEAGKRGSDGE